MKEKLSETLSPKNYESLCDVIDYIAKEHGSLNAYTCLGTTLTYSEVDDLSSRFAKYLQTETELKVGDKIAIQLLNLLQFPVVLFGAVKAGLIVVTTNPLYTPKEMEHQFKDSGVKAVVILESFCEKLEQVLPQTQISTVIVTNLGEFQPAIRKMMVNFGAKYIKKIVPSYSLPTAVNLADALACSADYERAQDSGAGDDVAVILYTGGTTGVAKGAMLSHRNLISNMMQLRSRTLSLIRDKVENIAAPLPLYHSYAFLLHCLAMPYAGNHNLLIPNPRDIDSIISLFKKFVINGFVGINTLYLAMLQHKDFRAIEFKELKFCGAGGMPMSTSVAQEWEEVTGREIHEGYGLTECSPVVSVNIPGRVRFGTVGELVPETESKVVDDYGIEVPEGERGELWVRGPQVMLGYWGDELLDEDSVDKQGWFKTGDYVEISKDGYITIVDRKKDMILMSGFNVFPNEIEDWVNLHPEVLECAAISIPNERTGEAVKLFVVAKGNGVSEELLIKHCKEGLTAYKVPKEYAFVDELPKSNIGKILRRELRA
ncbi:MAG: AMP-binding protein [Gammaproteobacteria bacterium]|nr:AMP-binding protein [Gammaproteobacteria bacterium]